MLVVMGFYSVLFNGEVRRPALFFLLFLSCYFFFIVSGGFLRSDYTMLYAQSSNTGTHDSSWLVRSFFWNQKGNTWLRTSCTMSVGGLGSLVSGESSQSSCSNTSPDKRFGFVQYYHDVDPDDTTPNTSADDVYGKLKGRAWSPFYGVVYFDSSDFPSSGNLASCYGLTGVARQARVRRLSGDVRLVGCAYVPLLKSYILFNKFGTTDSNVPSSDWNGVSVSTVEDSVSAYLTLYGCAWSLGGGFWSVGPNTTSALNNENCLPSGHHTTLRGVLPEARIGSPGGVLTTVNPTHSSAKIGQEVGYQYSCPDGYAAPSIRIGSRIVSAILSFFRGSYREIFTDPVDTLLLSCTDRTGVFTAVRNSAGAISTSVQNSLFISSFTVIPSVLTEGGFVSFGGQVSNQGGFSSRTFIDTFVGHCDNTVRNGCLNGTADDAVIADDPLYYKWRCEGVNGAAPSGDCQLAKTQLSFTTNQSKIVSSDRDDIDFFGYSVSIDGDTAVVGAYQEDDDVDGNIPHVDAGSAYVFTRTNNVWSQQAKLVASDRDAGDYFGISVSIDGDTVVIGAYSESHDANGGSFEFESGSAYVFTRTGSTWSQQAKLVASDRASRDEFGRSVSIDGDTVVVGAYNEDHDVDGGSRKNNAGSAYVFIRTNNVWSQQAKLVASDRDVDDHFGTSVSVDGDTVVVGARLEDHDIGGGSPKPGAGSAYVFTRTGSTWSQQAKLVAFDRDAGDDFGRSVSVDGDTVVVGAFSEDHDADGGGVQRPDAGSAYVFARIGDIWSRQAKLVASDRASQDDFGYSVSIDGDAIVVGAYREDHDAKGGSPKINPGSAFVFTRAAGIWSQQAKLVASDRDDNDLFGLSVSIGDGTAVVGAYNEDHDVVGGSPKPDAGSVYTFAVPVSGVCDNTVRNECINGVVDDDVIVDTPTHYRWQCVGVNGGRDSGACQLSKAVIPGNEGYCAIVNKLTDQKVYRFDVDGVAVPVSGSDLVVRDTVYDLQCQYKKFTPDGLFDAWHSIDAPSVAVKVLPRNVSERNVVGSVNLPVFSDTPTTVSVTIPPGTAMVYVYRLDPSSVRQIGSDSLYKIFVDRDAVELSDSETIDALKSRLFESAVQSKVVVVGSGSGSITRSAVVDKTLVAAAFTADGVWSQYVSYPFFAAGSCDNSVRHGCAFGVPDAAAEQDTPAEYRWRCSGTGGGSDSGRCSILRSVVAVGSCNNNIRNGCSTGTADDASEPDTAAEYRWRCSGTRGGGDSGRCSILKSSVVVGTCDNRIRNGCSTGVSNDVTESDTATEYRWRCEGAKGGGISGLCSIAKSSVIAGSCDNTVRNGCSTGTADATAEADTATEYRWQCSGTGGGSNSGSCSILKSSVAAGVCDNTVRNGCSTGTADATAEADTATEYRWRCSGTGGGSNSGSCSILKSSVAVGVCDNTVRNGCSTGTADATAEADTATEYRWRCSGVRGGSDSGICKKRKPVDGGWSPWAPLPETVACGDVLDQTRTCTNPSPAYGGAVCSGSASRQTDGVKCPKDQLCKNKKCTSAFARCAAETSDIRKWGSGGACIALKLDRGSNAADLPVGREGDRYTMHANVGSKGTLVFECTSSGQWVEVSSTCDG